MDINSVIIYLFTFFSSIACIYLSEHIKGSKFSKNIFTILGIFIVCLLAAMRDPSVGIDVKLYLVPNYNYAISSNLRFWEYFKTLPIDNELLFALLIYVVSKIGNFPLLCFLIELLVVSPVVYILKKERDTLSVTMGYSVFLLLFYNFSLSGMRASIAMSFFLLAFYYWNNSNIKHAVVCCIISFLFQKTALFIVVILITIYIIENSKGKRKIFLRGFLIGGTSIILLGYSKLAEYIIPVVNMINPRYGYYIRSYLLRMPGFTIDNVPGTDIVFKTLVIIIALIAIKRFDKMNKDNYFWLVMCLMGRYFVIFNAVFYESMRIAYFFDYFIILFVSSIGRGHKREYFNVITKLMIFACSIVYWFYFIIFIGGYGTNIYKFFWQ